MNIFDGLFGKSKSPQNGNPLVYHAFTTAFDKEVDAQGLDSVLGPLSSEAQKALDQTWDVFQTSLQAWRTSAHIAALEASGEIRRSVPDADRKDSVFTFLVDQSGSMRGQNMLLAAAAVDVAQDFVSRLGCESEILGFTTTSWQGGRSRKQWLAKGRPRHPGRLCDLLHVIYQSATEDKGEGTCSWQLRSMLRPDLPKENIDGEAVEWAAARLRKLPHARKFLIVISDGAPVDDSTLVENDLSYLDRHIRDVVAHLKTEAAITLSAIGIGHDVTPYYEDGVMVHTPEDLGQRLVEKVKELILK